MTQRPTGAWSGPEDQLVPLDVGRHSPAAFQPQVGRNLLPKAPSPGWLASKGGSFLENVRTELSFGDNQGPPSAACPTPWGCFVFAFQQVTSAKFPVGLHRVFYDICRVGGWLTPARRVEDFLQGPWLLGKRPAGGLCPGHICLL